MAHRQCARHHGVANVVELNESPDGVSFFLRIAFPDAARHRVRKYGRYGSISSEYPGSKLGVHLSDGIEFADLVSEASAFQSFSNYLLGMRSLRLVRTCGEDIGDWLVTSFGPDVVICPLEYKRVAAPISAELRLGDTSVKALMWSATSELILRRAELQYRARVQNWSVTSQVLLSARDLLTWDGFYACEQDAYDDWIWTGGSRIARFFVPRISGRKNKITLFLFAWRTELDRSVLEFRMDGRPLDASFLPHYQKVELTYEPEDLGDAGLLEIYHASLEATDDGSRQLGIAINKVRVETVQ